MMGEHKKRCRTCGGEFTLSFFRAYQRRRDMHITTAVAPDCVKCEQTERDDQKRRDRLPAKARSTRARHARSLGCTVDELRHAGWEDGPMVEAMRRAFAHVCDYCGDAYANMGNGYADVTIDIVDRDKAPFWGVNTKICCASCNREKGTMGVDAWGRRLADIREWVRNRARFSPPEQGALF